MKALFFGSMGGERAGCGIFRMAEGEEVPTLVYETLSPSYICANSAATRLYWLCEYNGGCKVGAADISKGFALIKEISTPLLSGACHISLTEDESALLLACYAEGQAAVVALDKNGAPTAFTCVIDHNLAYGEGRTCRVHYAAMLPGTDKALITDLGLGAVFLYTFSENTLSFFSRFDLPEGCGCRHAAFGREKDGKIPVYIVTELSNELYTLAFDTETSALSLLSAVTTLPEGLVCSTAGGAIRLSPDGKRIAVSNRVLSGGNGNIAVFPLGDGLPGKPLFYDTAGIHPRDFIWLDDDSILSLNMRSDSASVIELATGKAEAFRVPSVSCAVRV